MAIATTSRGAGQTGARGILSGSISNGATWQEDVEITEDGTVITNADDFEWRFTIRENYNDPPVLTLSTTDGTLTITQGSTSTTLSIDVPVDSMSDLTGNYICDLASKDNDTIVHWAHGLVEFRNEPVWS